MIVVIKSPTPASEIERIIQELRRYPVTAEKSVGKYKVVIGLVGDTFVSALENGIIRVSV